MQYILALDSGTTSTRASLYDLQACRIAAASRPLGCSYPQPGFVDQDPMEIFVSTVDAINEVLIRSGVRLSDLVGLGITSQRETTLLFDRKTGAPLTEAIVWQSSETAELAASYASHAEQIKAKTGLPISPYFSSSKIRFLLDKYQLQSAAEAGEVGFATIDAWLIYQLSEGRVFATDKTNASRTGLFNIFTGDYDDELLSLYSIPRAMLPQVFDSTANFGTTRLFGRGELKILGDAGDQQASLLGHQLVDPGGIKMTYGTGLFALLNTGSEPVISKCGLLTTIGLSHRSKIYYALEGSVFIGGAAVAWLRDKLELLKDSADSDQLSRLSTDEQVTVVPAFVGLGTPHWDSRCRGAIFGLTRGTGKNDLIRATLEGIGFEAYEVISAMKEEAKLKIAELKVDGGASDNDYLMQFQSDILNCRICRPSSSEVTSLGAMMLVGLSAGVFPDLESLKRLRFSSSLFSPQMDEKMREEKIARYQLAVKAARVFE